MSHLRLRLIAAVATACALVTIGGASAAPSELFFSEYIEGSSNNKALEIYNGTGAPIDLAAGGYSVAMYFNGSATAGVTINLTGTVAAGDVYVIAQSSASAAILAQADQTNGAGWFNGDDAVVLNKSGAPIDVIGQIASDPGTEWGTGLTSTADNTLRRKAAIEAGDTNGADAFDPSVQWDGFATDTFDGLGSHGTPPPDAAPSVSATAPAAGATDVARNANVQITFSEPVNLAAGSVSLSCTASGPHAGTVSGGPTTYTFDPDVDFGGGETCTVTVAGVGVTDQDTSDPPNAMAADHVFSFQTIASFACGDPATRIHQIQGSGATAALTGVQTIEGVVVGDYQGTGQFNGYFVQEENADQDGDALTSEGIFVFSGTGVDNVSAGDVVRVRGTASEFSGMTQLSSITNLAACGTGSVTATPVSLPVANVADHERFEGMLVEYDQTLTATEVFNLGRFGEVSLASERLRNPTAVALPGAPALAVAAQNNRSRIILDDANNQQNIDPTRYPTGGLSATNTLRVGDTLDGLTGVLEFRFSAYRIQPVGAVAFTGTNLRSTAPAPVGGNLKIASFNVLNYFNTFCADTNLCRGAENPFEFERQEAKIVSALKAIDADIFGLMEIENDGGPTSALAELVAALNDATAAGTYAFVDTGVIGTDAIKVALIYKAAVVEPVGAWDILTSADDPRFVDTRNRPTLAQTFRDLSSGQVLTVAVNHLKSKGTACPEDPDTGDGSGNCNTVRTNAAAALVDWLAGDPTGSGDPDVLIIGDLNSYTFETPIQELEAGGYTNLVRQFGGLAAYSYVFNGESGYLDHALGTASMVAQVTGVNEWHINPDEPTVLDYNTNFKSANHVTTLYDPGPYRSSDHDPVIVGVQLNHAPTADAGGPYTVAEGGSVTVTATGTDADGDTVTFAWDLDDDGEFDDAVGATASFSAAAIDGPANRTIRVRSSDGTANTTDSATVEITNVAPTATFNAPASAFAGFPFTLSLTDATDVAPADRPGLTYAFDCGSGYGAFSASSTASCPTDSVGTRSVGAKVRDDDGGVTEYRATVAVVVTFDSLCDLVRVYVDKPDVANSLCDKLDAAEAKAARTGVTDLHSFVNQVKAQSGKSMTAAEAATLIRLAGAL